MKQQFELPFELGTRDPSARVKLAAFIHLHGILTHCAPCDEVRWIAVLPEERHKGLGIAAIMADACRLYDEAGRIGYGRGELSAVRDLCQSLKIDCPL